MGWLSRWRGGGSAQARPPVRVVVISRRGCHLCQEMEKVVAATVTEPGTPPVDLDIVDLDEAAGSDPSLLERWSTLVPVLLVDGTEVGHWQVDAESVRQAVRR